MYWNKDRDSIYHFITTTTTTKNNNITNYNVILKRVLMSYNKKVVKSN